MNLSEIELPSPVARDVAAADRRRPGRPQQVNPKLVPLLRGEFETDVDVVSPDLGDPDQLTGMKGIAVGVAMSTALWVGVLYTGRWLFF